MVSVRRVRKGDLGELDKLFQQLSGVETDIEKMKHNFEIIQKNNDYIVLGAELDGKIVGTVMGIVCTDFVGECKPFMVIENVVVSSAHRDNGIGRKLFEELERMAKERDCSYTMLVSRKERTGAHKFYQSVGYGLDVVQGFKKYL